MGEPIKELELFAARLTEDLAERTKQLQQILIQLSGTKFESFDQKQAIATEINRLADRLGVVFDLGDGEAYRLRVSKGSRGTGSFVFQSAANQAQYGGAAFPPVSQIKFKPRPLRKNLQ